MSTPTESSRRLFLAEVISTERSYLADMQGFFDVYVKPLAQKWNPTAASDASPIFMQLESATNTVLTVGKALLREMEEAEQVGEFPSTVGTIFTTWSPMLKSYRDYITMYSTVMEEFRMQHSLNKRFRALVNSFIAKKEQQDKIRHLTFEDMLIMPIQRVPRYELLLSNILKASIPGDPGYEELKVGLAAIKKTASHLNDSLSRKDAIDTVAAIQRTLIISPAPTSGLGLSRFLSGSSAPAPANPAEIDIVTPTRAFVAEGDFHFNTATLSVDIHTNALRVAGLHPRMDALQRYMSEAAASVREVPVRAFLFNDLLLFTLPKNGKPQTAAKSQQQQYELILRVPLSSSLSIEMRTSPMPTLCISVPASSGGSDVIFRVFASAGLDLEAWARLLPKPSPQGLDTDALTKQSTMGQSHGSGEPAPALFRGFEGASFVDAEQLSAELARLRGLVLQSSAPARSASPRLQKSSSFSSLMPESPRAKQLIRSSVAFPSYSASEDDRILIAHNMIKKGTLEKQSPGLLGGWRSRYFVLRVADAGATDLSRESTLYSRQPASGLSDTTRSSISIDEDEDDGKLTEGLRTARANGAVPDVELGRALSGMLEYYKDPSHVLTGVAPAGAIPLSQISSVHWLGMEKPGEAKFGAFGFGASSDKARRLDIRTGYGRLIELRAPTDADARNWAMTLTCLIELRDQLERERRNTLSNVRVTEEVTPDVSNVARTEALPDIEPEVPVTQSLVSEPSTLSEPSTPEVEVPPVPSDDDTISETLQAHYELPKSQKVRKWAVSTEQRKAPEGASGEVVTSSLSVSEVLKKLQSVENSRKSPTAAGIPDDPKAVQNSTPAKIGLFDAVPAFPAKLMPTMVEETPIIDIGSSWEGLSATGNPVDPRATFVCTEVEISSISRSGLLRGVGEGISFVCSSPARADEQVALMHLQEALSTAPDSLSLRIQDARTVCEVIALGYAKVGLPMHCLRFLMLFDEVCRQYPSIHTMPTPAMYASVVLAFASAGQLVPGLECAQLMLQQVMPMVPLACDGENQAVCTALRRAVLYVLSECGLIHFVRTVGVGWMLLDGTEIAPPAHIAYHMMRAAAVDGHVQACERILHGFLAAKVPLSTVCINVMLRCYADFGCQREMHMLGAVLMQKLKAVWSQQVSWRAHPQGGAFDASYHRLFSVWFEPGLEADQPAARAERRASRYLRSVASRQGNLKPATRPQAHEQVSPLFAKLMHLMEDANILPSTATFMLFAEHYANSGRVEDTRATCNMLSAASVLDPDKDHKYHACHSDSMVDAYLQLSGMAPQVGFTYPLECYAFMARAHCVSGDNAAAIATVSDMAKQTGNVDDRVIQEVMPAYAASSGLASCKELYADIVRAYNGAKSGSRDDVHRCSRANSIMVKIFVESGDFDAADQVLTNMYMNEAVTAMSSTLSSVENAVIKTAASIGIMMRTEVPRAFLEAYLGSVCSSELKPSRLDGMLTDIAAAKVLPSANLYAVLLTSTHCKNDVASQLSLLSYLSELERSQLHKTILLLSSLFPEEAKPYLIARLTTNTSLSRGGIGCAYVRACITRSDLTLAKAVMELVSSGGFSTQQFRDQNSWDWAYTLVPARLESQLRQLASLDMRVFPRQDDLLLTFNALITAFAADGQALVADGVCASMESLLVSNAFGGNAAHGSSVEDTYKSLMVTYGLQGRVQSARTAFESLQRLRARKTEARSGPLGLEEVDAHSSNSLAPPRRARPSFAGTGATRLSKCVTSQLFDDSELVPLEGISLEGSDIAVSIEASGAVSASRAASHTGSDPTGLVTKSTAARPMIRQGVAQTFTGAFLRSSALAPVPEASSVILLHAQPAAGSIEQPDTLVSCTQMEESEGDVGPVYRLAADAGSDPAMPQADNVNDDAKAYNMLILSYAENGQLDLAVAVLEEMQLDDVCADPYTVVSLILAHSICGQGHRALDVCGTVAQVMLNIGCDMPFIESTMYSTEVTVALLYSFACEGRTDLVRKAWQRWCGYHLNTFGKDWTSQHTLYDQLCDVYLFSLASAMNAGAASFRILGNPSDRSEASQLASWVVDIPTCADVFEEVLQMAVLRSNTVSYLSFVAVTMAYAAVGQKATAKKLFQLVLPVGHVSSSAPSTVNDVTFAELLLSMMTLELTAELRDMMYALGVQSLAEGHRLSRNHKRSRASMQQRALSAMSQIAGGLSDNGSDDDLAAISHVWFAGLCARNDTSGVVTACAQYATLKHAKDISSESIMSIAESDNLGAIAPVLLSRFIVSPPGAFDSVVRHTTFMYREIGKDEPMSHLLCNMRLAMLCGTDRLRDALCMFLSIPSASAPLGRFRAWPECLTLLLWCINRDIAPGNASFSRLHLPLPLCEANGIVGLQGDERATVNICHGDGFLSVVQAVLSVAGSCGLSPRDVDLALVAEIHGSTGNFRLALCDLAAKPSTCLAHAILRGMSRWPALTVAHCEVLAKRMLELEIPIDSAMEKSVMQLSMTHRKDYQRVFASINKLEQSACPSLGFWDGPANQGAAADTAAGNLSCHAVACILRRYTFLRLCEDVSLSQEAVPEKVRAAFVAVIQQTTDNLYARRRDAAAAEMKKQQLTVAVSQLTQAFAATGLSDSAPTAPTQVSKPDVAATISTHQAPRSPDSNAAKKPPPDHGFEIFLRKTQSAASGAWKTSLLSSPPTDKTKQTASLVVPAERRVMNGAASRQARSSGPSDSISTANEDGVSSQLHNVRGSRADEILGALTMISPVTEFVDIPHDFQHQLSWSDATHLLEERVRSAFTATVKAEVDVASVLCDLQESHLHLERLSSHKRVANAVHQLAMFPMSTAIPKYKQQLQTMLRSLAAAELDYQTRVDANPAARVLFTEYTEAIDTMANSQNALRATLENSRRLSEVAGHTSQVSRQALQLAGGRQMGTANAVSRCVGDCSSYLLSNVAARVQGVRTSEFLAFTEHQEAAVCWNKWLEALETTLTTGNARMKNVLTYLVTELGGWSSRFDEEDELEQRLRLQLSKLAVQADHRKAEFDDINHQADVMAEEARQTAGAMARRNLLTLQNRAQLARAENIKLAQMRTAQIYERKLIQQHEYYNALVQSELANLERDMLVRVPKEALRAIGRNAKLTNRKKAVEADAASKHSERRNATELIDVEMRTLEHLSAAIRQQEQTLTFFRAVCPRQACPLPSSACAEELCRLTEDLDLDAIDVLSIFEEAIAGTLPELTNVDIAVLGMSQAGVHALKPALIGPGFAFDGSDSPLVGTSSVDEQYCGAVLSLDALIRLYQDELSTLRPSAKLPPTASVPPPSPMPALPSMSPKPDVVMVRQQLSGSTHLSSEGRIRLISPTTTRTRTPGSGRK